MVIDDDGYRNPHGGSGPYEIVLLGDSVTIAVSAEKDVGQHLRDRGARVLNLGFAGYGPGQYRDAYLSQVIDRNVKHDFVAVVFCFCNDIGNTVTYSRLERFGGDWRNYLGKGRRGNVALPSPLNKSWSIVAASSLATEWAGSLKKFTSTEQLVTAKFNWTTAQIPRPEHSLRGAGASDQTWSAVEKYLGSVAARARSVGAKPVIFAYPGQLGLYVPFVEGLTELDSAFSGKVERLREVASAIGAGFVDLRPALVERFESTNIVNSIGDYHPNSEGTAVMASEILRSARSSK